MRFPVELGNGNLELRSLPPVALNYTVSKPFQVAYIIEIDGDHPMFTIHNNQLTLRPSETSGAPRHTRPMVRIFLVSLILIRSADAGEPGSGNSNVALHQTSIQLYNTAPEHLWNRLHGTLVGVDRDDEKNVSYLNPLLNQRNTLLLEGSRHQVAMAVLDEFLNSNHDQPPLNRLLLQRELWAAFDSMAWCPDEWTHLSKHEPAAIALRGKLAKAIGLIALTTEEISKLPDNFLSSAQSILLRDPSKWKPEQLTLIHEFLATSFGDNSPWIAIQEVNPSVRQLIAQEHSAAIDARAAFEVLLNLPDGREATLAYLQKLTADNVIELPVGTKIALVRMALAIDRNHHVQVTKFVESVQFRSITASSSPSSESSDIKMKVLELVLDRGSPHFATTGTMRVINEQEKAIPFNGQSTQLISDLNSRRENAPLMQLQSCALCHQGHGLNSVLSMQRGLRQALRITDAQRRPLALPTFSGSSFLIERKTATAKTGRYDWGLLQGLLESSH